jgi:hypothetical protein
VKEAPNFDRMMRRPFSRRGIRRCDKTGRDREIHFPLLPLVTNLPNSQTRNARGDVQDSPPPRGVGVHFAVLSVGVHRRGRRRQSDARFLRGRQAYARSPAVAKLSAGAASELRKTLPQIQARLKAVDLSGSIVSRKGKALRAQ